MEIKVTRPNQDEIKALGILSWPIWQKEKSRFEWFYAETEICYFLEGQVLVEFEDGKTVSVGKGDLVTFPKDLSCIWHIEADVKKHYNFKE